ncbi:hypothetical protein HPP92_014094 [Vanilla planifolia]|uniref:Uncharacterized protein n=1 Tax=Vanilla planifolia TaxID=51239 RepID=A0A835QSX1_VANPL|nr:hypothetical protein HPP92_014094 [Vanilla planifolia]
MPTSASKGRCSVRGQKIRPWRKVEEEEEGHGKSQQGVKANELRGARADGIKNIDSFSLSPESKKRFEGKASLGYDVSVSLEGPKTLSVLKQKRC